MDWIRKNQNVHQKISTMQKKSNQLLRFVIVSLLLFSVNLHAQNSSIKYKADDKSIFPNPERGWAVQFIPICCDSLAGRISRGPHSPITVSLLKQLQSTPEAMTVYLDVIKIQEYDRDIPQSRLDAIQADIDVAREAGMKLNFRICYNYGMHFGEASEYWIDRHLDQFGPMIKKNADVIMAVDAGMYGGSGEACCNSAFLDSASNNGWSGLNESGLKLYNKLISFIPPSRSMQLRYPRYKYDMMGWENGNKFPVAATPLTAKTAYNGSMQARLGFHGDNFAGDVDHFGFFDPWGKPERKFTEADTKYTYMRGEVSTSTPFNNKNGAAHMAKYHFTTFHGLGNVDTNSSIKGYDGWPQASAYWKKTGQYDQMTKKLGYRFILNSATLPSGSFSPGAPFNMSFIMTNSGWSGIVNPRNFEIVFKNKKTNAAYRIVYDGDGKGNRMFLPRDGETKVLNVKTSLPMNITPGTYDMFLHLADPYPSIHDRPDYSIRLANERMWQPDTGFNKLNHSVTIVNRLK
jgi:hypothetical protein